MPVRARLVATIPALLSSAKADAPAILGAPGRRLLGQRGDDELVVRVLDDASPLPSDAVVRFAAPWPRRRGTWAVAPDASLAVFVGVHALRAVEPSGAVRWEIRHGCWYGACQEMHASYDEYADREDHRYPERGSAGFSVDGKLVWAHVRGPLAEGELSADTVDEWLVLDAEDGRVLARVNAEAAAAGSFHLAHPGDPTQMGLSIGEGQDGAPLRWGRWDGQDLAVDCFGGEDLVLLSVSPSGERLMTVTHDQDVLAIRSTCDGSVLEGLELDAELVVPRHPDAEPDNDEIRPYWDWAGGFIDEATVIGGTVESDAEWRQGRHWLIDASRPHELSEVAYPFPVSGQPAAIGDGTWYTLSESGDGLHVWAL